MEDMEPAIFNNNSRKEGMVLAWEIMIIAVLIKKKKRKVQIRIKAHLPK